MPSADEHVELLSRAVDQTEAIIARVEPEQASLPTPDSGWDVRDLVEHVVVDVRKFTNRASGSGSAEQDVPGGIGEDWTRSYREASDALLAAWRRDGALEGMVELPFGEFPPTWFVGQQVTDLVVHGWDLARATGQPTDLDQELGQFSLDWGRENLRPEFRGRDFGPEVLVPEDAPLYDRLAAFFGRDPAKAP
jgi:uncharacterized protein (TIGR03086 family)